MSNLQPVYVVTWQEWEAPPVGTKRGHWVDYEEILESEEEADSLINEVAGEGHRNIVFEKRYV